MELICVINFQFPSIVHIINENVYLISELHNYI